MKVIRHQKHIDNGRFSIDFDIDGGVPSIEFITHYHGIASVSTKLSGLYLDPISLREIAEYFKLFADAYEEVINDADSNEEKE